MSIYLNIKLLIINMEDSFIQKYQPLVISDFELDENLIKSIQELIEIGNLNILFVGKSGTGKTSLIQSIINEYFGDLPHHIMHVNNLKDQGIHYYRSEVKTFCQTSTFQNKKKIILLDDLDNINEQSQQVFRNAMDKYGHNINFICSCSNIQKVIESIQSRLIILRINSCSEESLNNIMEKIIKREKIQFEGISKNKMLKLSNGSIRALINYLEKCKLYNKLITEDLVELLCTNIHFNDLKLYFRECQNKNLIGALEKINVIFNSGFSVIDILDYLFFYIKLNDFIDVEIKYKIIKLLCKYIAIFHNTHEDEFELYFLTNKIIKLF